MSEEVSSAIAQEDKGKAPGTAEYLIALLLIVITAVVVVALYGSSIRSRFEKLGSAKTATEQSTQK